MACHGNPKPIACVTMIFLPGRWLGHLQSVDATVSRDSHFPEDLMQPLSMDQAMMSHRFFVVDVGMDLLDATRFVILNGYVSMFLCTATRLMLFNWHGPHGFVENFAIFEGDLAGSRV